MLLVRHFLLGANLAVFGIVLSAKIDLFSDIILGENPLRIGINMLLLGVALLVIGKLKWHPAIGLGIGTIVGAMLGFVTHLA